MLPVCAVASGDGHRPHHHAAPASAARGGRLCLAVLADGPVEQEAKRTRTTTHTQRCRRRTSGREESWAGSLEGEACEAKGCWSIVSLFSELQFEVPKAPQNDSQNPHSPTYSLNGGALKGRPYREALPPQAPQELEAFALAAKSGKPEKNTLYRTKDRSK